MKRLISTVAAFVFPGLLVLSAATRIDDPKNFVTEVYRRFVAAQSTTNSAYTPPDDIYTARLAKLIRDDKRRAKGEVGCLDFDFWLNAQDWKITDPVVTTADASLERETVIAKFLNLGDPQEIHFDFRRTAGRWQLDDVHSLSAPPWTLSEILKCAP
jgi:Protein of unknown function (DUF3828)